MSNHTTGPWRLSFPTSPESDAKVGIRSEIGYEVIADGLTRANAQHIIECVNAKGFGKPEFSVEQVYLIDLGGFTDDEKITFLKKIVLWASNALVTCFLSFEMKSHIQQMVVVGKDSFVLTLRKMDGPDDESSKKDLTENEFIETSKMRNIMAALESALPLLESCAATHTNGERIYKQALEALNKAKQQ